MDCGAGGCDCLVAIRNPGEQSRIAGTARATVEPPDCSLLFAHGACTLRPPVVARAVCPAIMMSYDGVPPPPPPPPPPPQGLSMRFCSPSATPCRIRRSAPAWRVDASAPDISTLNRSRAAGPCHARAPIPLARDFRTANFQPVRWRMRRSRETDKALRRQVSEFFAGPDNRPVADNTRKSRAQIPAMPRYFALSGGPSNGSVSFTRTR